MPWHYDPGAGIFRPPSPHGHPHASNNVSGSGSRARPLEILHPPNDCTHCHAYKVHVILACLQDDVALERHCTGISPEYSLGDCYSPDPDPELRDNLRRVRQERDEAVALNVSFRDEVALLESQLREAKDGLVAMAIAYGVETQEQDVEPSDEERESRYDGLRPMEAEQDDDDVEGNLAGSHLDADIEMDEPWTIESPIDQNDASDDFEIFQQIHLMTQEVEWTSWENDFSSDDQQEIPQNSTLENSIDSSSDSPSSTSSLLLSASDWVDNQSDDCTSPPPLTKPTSSDEELHQTLKLMASAHEVGNTTALATVKKLIIRAEKTPRHDRTKAQNYILLNWRSPESSGRNNNTCPSLALPAPSIYPIPSSTNGPEIFVDASASGIGFVFKTQWLAWTFKKTSKIPFGPDGRVVMSWAELLAVELGLRALITGGYRSTNITIRSDNTGVIDALRKKTWCPRYGIEEMLQNILILCGEYGIQLRPSWISTKMNPADKPSRGVYPPWSLAFKFPPKLPSTHFSLNILSLPLLSI